MCQVQLDKKHQSILSAFNIATSSTAAFLCCLFMLMEERRKARMMQDSLERAEHIAQKIVDFDLDGIPAQCPEEDEAGIVDLLHQVATNLARWRPYLPDHTLAHYIHDPGCADADCNNNPLNTLEASAGHTVAHASTMSPTSEEACPGGDAVDAIQTPPAPITQSDSDGFATICQSPISLEGVSPSRTSLLDLREPAREAKGHDSSEIPKSRLQMHTELNRPIELRTGTLLYIHLGNLDDTSQAMLRMYSRQDTSQACVHQIPIKRQGSALPGAVGVPAG